MKKGSKPSKFFNQLKALKVQYDGDITDEMLINEVMVKAPIKYQSMIATECRSKGTNLKLEHLKDCMNELYRMGANSNNGFEEDGSDDEANGGELIGNAFSGECYICGKRGHRAAQCPEKKTGNGHVRKTFRKGKGGFNGTCHNCGKRGHKAHQCWKLKENAHKRPKG